MPLLSKDDLIRETRCMVKALDNSTRQIADNLAVLRDKYDMSQRRIAAEIEKSVGWVNRMLAWREAGFPEDTPFGGTERRRKMESVQPAEHRKVRTRKAETRRATKSTTSGNRLFDAAEGFYKSELAGVDDKTFDRVMKMFAEWRQASKPSNTPRPVVKIGKEPVKSLDGFSESAKRQIAAAVAGNAANPQETADERKAEDANLAIPDDGSIPDFLQRAA